MMDRCQLACCKCCQLCGAVFYLSLYWVISVMKNSNANIPVWRTTSTSRHSSQTTTTFSLVNVSGCSTYSYVYRRRQNVSCCSHSPVHLTSLLPPLCCCLKSHFFSLSRPAFWLLLFVQKVINKKWLQWFITSDTAIIFIALHYVICISLY